jgi:hypothetical protein
MLQSKDFNLDKEISLVLIMALRTDRQYSEAHCVWGFRTCSYFQQYKDEGSFLSCIKEIYVTFLQNCTQYSLFSVFGMLSFISSSFLLFIPIYLLITIYFLLDMTSADLQGFKINNLYQKNYLLQLYL